MRRIVSPVVAVLLVALAWIAVPGTPGAAAVDRAGSGLAFERALLPQAEHDQKVRPVAPDLEPIQPWISAVGTSVAALDLRNQGHAGDGCTTDPRDDTVRVFPVPGSSGDPFDAFELHPTGLRYDATMAPIGCVPADVNADGATDILVYYWGRSPVLFLNQQIPGPGDEPVVPGAADFVATELVSPMQVWNTTALNVADVDGDGALDVLVGNYFPDGARVLDPDAADDPRMQMQHSMGKARNAGINRLYLGQADVEPGEAPRFTDVSNRIPDESARSWTLAIGFQDLTGNGLPDIYAANDFGPDQLLVNTSTPGDVRLDVVRGRRDLTERKSSVLGHDSFKGMGVAYTYAAGEELPEIYVSNITSPWALQESNFAFQPDGDPESLFDGVVPYTDRSGSTGIAHSGWSWDIKAVDLLNSGRDDLVQATGFIQGDRDLWPRLQEIAMGNDLILQNPEVWLRIEQGDDLSGHEPNRVWRDQDGSWVDVGAAVGFTDQDVSRGIAPGDFDADGLADFMVANQWQDSYVYRNESTTDNRWITLHVVRPTAAGATTPLIGATVRVQGDGYERESQLYPANGHSGVAAPELHFGIPDEFADTALSATVSWVEDGETRTRTFDLVDGQQTLEVSR
ncbi:CRTAC1 family protein [Myceligenerans indicum]|uniref:CRTAC1 family protein n=1 Tax=Myceligenerans indicum TaxID=2593663 RepID=A0ABS1LLV8_9MICO|nr:CRTAC1 family protein [Myceligenerans indicum]MBL0887260.1 CRTAC1 family protein [Myceligenerans indicum]